MTMKSIRTVRSRIVAAAAAATLGATALAIPAAADADDFTEILSFEGYDRSDLDGQDEWIASPAAKVIADPLNGNNQLLEMTGGQHAAHRAIPAIPDGGTGTVFFRFLRTGKIDTSFGITDVEEPSDYTDSRAYVNNQQDDVMRVRDGGGFTGVGHWSEGSWQCVWLVADNDADRVSVYTQGGPYEGLTRLPEGAEEDFAFRQNVDGALDRFFWINNGAAEDARLMLDDLAIDNTGANLEIPTGNPAD